MTNPKLLLFLALGVVTVVFAAAWARSLMAAKASGNGAAAPTAGQTGIGFVTDFFDTLGIGCFAPTTALYRFFKMVPDEKIPGTLNVGFTLGTVAQAFIYITIVEVDFTTLLLLIVASMAGAWLGAGVVSNWPKRHIQIGMGLALLVAAILFIRTNMNPAAGSGTELALTGTKLVIGVVGNFALGALMTLGIGLYGPALIMISLLGMDPRAAFPIMMGSCAFLMPVASLRFLKAQAYDAKAAIGLAIGGVPAVLLAAFIVKSMDLVAVRWLVVVVVLIAAIGLLRSGLMKQRA
ncbi:MAG: sulfite exporter TauE/SafE family protein [Gemmatimonadales bacterium]|nr:sulfite exporter TauE/SafE family protein [Gemmatimonadales bacterium]